MPHLPLTVWIVLGLVPAVIVLVLAVEAWIVRPSVEDERRGGPSAKP